MIDQILFRIKTYIPRRLFLFFQPAYHFCLSFFAALFYGFPSRRLFVIGVTGTKGKTTVVELLHALLEESGAPVASLSSLRFRIGNHEARNERHMTLPGRFFVQRFLYDASRAGCRYAVLEVTSEGIKQYRHRFIDFDAAVMTNISPEHIESHGSFEKYLRAKLDLFWRLCPGAIAVIRSQDPNCHRFSAATAAEKVYYSLGDIMVRDRRWGVRNIEVDEGGIRFQIDDIGFSSLLLGDFNVENILAAVAFGLARHMSLEKIAAGIFRTRAIPGRMEYIPASVKTSAGEQKEFVVVVDYAHTPESLRRVYEAVRPYHASIICVLGAAGGGRDTWKRPEFGKIAAEHCNEIILTNEDPYDENPAAILDEIEAGFSKIKSPKPRAQKILDRREAIRRALALSKPGDAVVITGKGAEPYIMGPKHTKIPWDDRAVVREELVRMRQEATSG